jgi:hypothetical protein
MNAVFRVPCFVFSVAGTWLRRGFGRAAIFNFQSSILNSQFPP